MTTSLTTSTVRKTKTQVSNGLSKKQREFIANSNSRVNILEGSIRSGKTIAVILRFFLFIAKAPRNGELAIIGASLPVIHRNVVSPMQNEGMFGVFAKHVVGVSGANQIRVFGRVVHLIGAADSKAEKTIRGMTIAGAFVDEITVIPEEFFTQLLGRMSVRGAKLFGTTNPDGPNHWFKKKFLDRIGVDENPLRGWTRWFFSIDDNPTLDPDYVRDVKNSFTGLFYRRFILGEWCAAEGAIFDFWDPNKHVVAFNDLPEITRMFACGIDYGTTHPTSCIVLGLGVDGKLYLVNEWRYEAKDNEMRLNDHTMATEILKWLDGPLLPAAIEHGMKPEIIFVDPAAASLKTMLKNMGVKNVKDADNSVLYGIRTMSSLFTQGQLLVSDKCPGFISEVPGYSWDPAAALKGEDKPVKTADDSIDPARYAIISTQSRWYKMLS